MSIVYKKVIIYKEQVRILYWLTSQYLIHQKNYLWLIRVRNLEFLRLGNCNLSRNKGLASINFLSSTNMIALADFVSPYLDNCSFSLKYNKKQSKLSASYRSFTLSKKLYLYLKFSSVKSCVISLNNSSLNVENTFKSFTNISTPLDRSCLRKIKQKQPKISSYTRSASNTHLFGECLENIKVKS